MLLFYDVELIYMLDGLVNLYCISHFIRNRASDSNMGANFFGRDFLAKVGGDISCKNPGYLG